VKLLWKLRELTEGAGVKKQSEAKGVSWSGKFGGGAVALRRITKNRSEAISNVRVNNREKPEKFGSNFQKRGDGNKEQQGGDTKKIW